MSPGDAVEIRKLLAAGDPPLRAWCQGYTVVAFEPQAALVVALKPRTVLVRCERGVFAGCVVRFLADSVRMAGSRSNDNR